MFVTEEDIIKISTVLKSGNHEDLVVKIGEFFSVYERVVIHSFYTLWLNLI